MQTRVSSLQIATLLCQLSSLNTHGSPEAMLESFSMPAFAGTQQDVQSHNLSRRPWLTADMTLILPA